jgi:hypothetical protein
LQKLLSHSGPNKLFSAECSTKELDLRTEMDKQWPAAIAAWLVEQESERTGRVAI